MSYIYMMKIYKIIDLVPGRTHVQLSQVIKVLHANKENGSMTKEIPLSNNSTFYKLPGCNGTKKLHKHKFSKENYKWNFLLILHEVEKYAIQKRITKSHTSVIM
jgi:hypothetical protein